MSRDQIIGALLVTASIVIAIVYVWALFFSPWSWWAIVIPMLIAVIGVLGIIGWIGYTLATTPPPEEITFEEEEKKEEVEKEEKK